MRTLVADRLGIVSPGQKIVELEHSGFELPGLHPPFQAYGLNRGLADPHAFP